MEDRPSPRFTLLGEALRTKKVGIYDEIDYPPGYEGKVVLRPQSTGADTTIVLVTMGGGSMFRTTALLWKTSVGEDVGQVVRRAIVEADQSARDSALNDLRDRIDQYRPES